MDASYARLVPDNDTGFDIGTNDPEAPAQAPGEDVATFVDDAPWYADQTLREADALKNEALRTASDAATGTYNQVVSRWPDRLPQAEVVGFGVGGQAISQPPLNSAGQDGTHPKPPKEPDAPVERTVDEAVQRLTGPRAPDNESELDNDPTPDSDEKPPARASHQTERPQTAPAPRSQGPPSGRPLDRDEMALAPATQGEIIPSPGLGLGFAVAATTLATFAFGTWILSRTRIVGRLIAGLPFARLFSRQAGTEVLQNPVRAQIHVAISHHAGITSKSLSEVTRIRASSVRYHVGVLQREGLVRVVRDGKILHYHPARADPQAKAAQCLFLKHRGLLAKTILGKPGASQKRLAQEMGVAASSVCLYVRDLTRAGLVQTERAGRSLRYFPTALLEGIHEKGMIPEA